MKLIDILNEKREIPTESKIDLSVIKEYIFKDWQTFNQKLVPSFRILRKRCINETYTSNVGKNNLMRVVDFAVKKYVAENTDRKYNWNHVITLNERINLAKQLVEFFEKYNLSDKFELLSEDSGLTRDGSISFDTIEIEIIKNKPFIALNFKYDESTTNYLIGLIPQNKTVKLSDFDTQTIQGMVTFNLKTMGDNDRISYLKFYTFNNNISRTDLKHLIGILNKRVTLNVTELQSEQPPQEEQPDSEEVDNVNVQNEPQAIEKEPTPSGEIEAGDEVNPEITDKELKEIVMQSIKEIIGEYK